MIATENRTIVVGFLLVAVFVYKATSTALHCVDPDYLPHLQNEVRPFYTLTTDASADLLQEGPCSFADGNQIGKPRWPVYTLESWHAAMSTCPWGVHVDEDVTGYRFPCRIATARLVWDGLEDDTNPDHRQRCLREPGTRHHRSDGKVCKHLVQDVPVVTRTGCRNGVNDYAVMNITITVGFTCAFG